MEIGPETSQLDMPGRVSSFCHGIHGGSSN